jgi:hypothetical protein
MARVEVKTGIKFGRWTVLGLKRVRGEPQPHWKKPYYWMAFCRCECGTTRWVEWYALQYKKSKSCGCIKADRNKEVHGGSKHHSYKHGLTQSGAYVSWCSMKQRVLNPKRNANWGGRGITICDRWLGESGFQNFILDMGERPEGKSLERKDVNGNYEPDNCKWATAYEQCHNRRNSAVDINVDEEDPALVI